MNSLKSSIEAFLRCTCNSYNPTIEYLLLVIENFAVC